MRPTLARVLAFPLGALLAVTAATAAHADPEPSDDPPPPPPPTRVTVDPVVADKATLRPSSTTQRVTYRTTIRVRDAEAAYLSLSVTADSRVLHKITRFWITARNAESCGRGVSRVSVMCFWPAVTPPGSDLPIRLEMDVKGTAAGDRFDLTFEADADNLYDADPAEVKRTVTTRVVSPTRKTR